MRECEIEWFRPDSDRERARLESWRVGVGEPVFLGPVEGDGTPGAVVDEVAVAVWNTHVGAADLVRFVSDLERGRLTGGAAVEHFVLLLQEVHRAGAGVPRRLGPARAAPRIHGTPPSGSRADLVSFARERNLYALYVPSMRNGRESVTDTPEDRGNAILSTLPLSKPRAFELPFERQRRVAVGARVAIPSPSGLRGRLDVVNLHLDPRSDVLRAHRSFGAGREGQVAWLLEALGHDAPVVVGGDFNTWAFGRAEGALVRMRSRFAEARAEGRGTIRVASAFPALALDHLFFDVPKVWRSRFSVHPDTYGSDHCPILGRFEIA